MDLGFPASLGDQCHGETLAVQKCCIPSQLSTFQQTTPSTAGCNFQPPVFAAAGERQEAHGSTELNLQRPCSSLLLTGQSPSCWQCVMAVISHSLGGCRAEQEGQSQEEREDPVPVPEPPATTRLCPPLGVAQPGCACCVLAMDTWNRRYSGTGASY